MLLRFSSGGLANLGAEKGQGGGAGVPGVLVFPTARAGGLAISADVRGQGARWGMTDAACRALSRAGRTVLPPRRPRCGPRPRVTCPRPLSPARLRHPSPASFDIGLGIPSASGPPGRALALALAHAHVRPHIHCPRSTLPSSLLANLPPLAPRTLVRDRRHRPPFVRAAEIAMRGGRRLRPRAEAPPTGRTVSVAPPGGPPWARERREACERARRSPHPARRTPHAACRVPHPARRSSLGCQVQTRPVPVVVRDADQ